MQDNISVIADITTSKTIFAEIFAFLRKLFLNLYCNHDIWFEVTKIAT